MTLDIPDYITIYKENVNQKHNFFFQKVYLDRNFLKACSIIKCSAIFYILMLKKATELFCP